MYFFTEDSITAALFYLYGSSYDFRYTLRRFGEALVYTNPLPEGAMSFDKTVSNTINGIIYTSYGFNVWDFKNSYKYDETNLYEYFNNSGPWINSIDYWATMAPYSIALYSDPTWLHRTGNISITLKRPEYSNIRFILMVF